MDQMIKGLNDQVTLSFSIYTRTKEKSIVFRKAHIILTFDEVVESWWKGGGNKKYYDL